MLSYADVMRARWPLGGLFAVVAAGCGGPQGGGPQNAATVEREPRPTDQVHIYTTGPPDRAFQRVARIEARYSDREARENVLALLREKAGRMGCDGIIVDSANVASCIVDLE